MWKIAAVKMDGRIVMVREIFVDLGCFFCNYVYYVLCCLVSKQLAETSNFSLVD